MKSTISTATPRGRAARSVNGAIAQQPTATPDVASTPAILSPDSASHLADLKTPATDISDLARLRATRRPFGSRIQKLAYPVRPGFHRHWFNDTPGRLIDAEAAGFRHVKDHDGKNVVRAVGVTEAGTALEAYLMEIQQELYNEDMANQQIEGPDKIEAAIRRGADERGEPGRDGRYIPSQGIKIARA